MQYRSLEALFHADRSNERFTKYAALAVGTARKYSRLLEEKDLIEPVTRSPLRFVLTRTALDLLGIKQSCP
jgi:hypothetical protein